MTDPPDQPDAPASENADSTPNPELGDLFNDPVLYPPDLPSPEEVALRKDLSAYDNGDVYFDPSQPQIFTLNYRSFLLPDKPSLLYAELNGELLPDHLLDATWDTISRDPHFQERLREHGCKDLAEYRRAFETEEAAMAPRFKTDQWEFFLRHFPKLFEAVFNMAVFSAFMGMGLSLWREQPDEQLKEFEKTVRETLEIKMTAFEKMVKGLVGTRSVGRPKNIYAERELPEIVRTVLRIAHEIMGDARGKDAVPGLKAIALQLNTNEGALGRRLRLAGHPWTGIRTYLENIPADQT